MNNITFSSMKGDKFEIKFDTKEQVDAILEKYKRTRKFFHWLINIHRLNTNRN